MTRYDLKDGINLGDIPAHKIGELLWPKRKKPHKFQSKVITVKTRNINFLLQIYH